jgi:hypothetical protein
LRRLFVVLWAKDVNHARSACRVFRAPFLLHIMPDFDGLRPAQSDIQSAEILEFFGFSGTRSGVGYSGS